MSEKADREKAKAEARRLKARVGFLTTAQAILAVEFGWQDLVGCKNSELYLSQGIEVRNAMIELGIVTMFGGNGSNTHDASYGPTVCADKCACGNWNEAGCHFCHSCGAYQSSPEDEARGKQYRRDCASMGFDAAAAKMIASKRRQDETELSNLARRLDDSQLNDLVRTLQRSDVKL